MKDELIITEANFHEYFRDIRNNKIQKGEVIARWTGMAEFIDGHMKRDIIDLLHNKNKLEAAIQVMRKLGSAIEKDAIRVCKEICQDLANGLTWQQVEEKVYHYQLEFFYYTKKEYIPLDDTHWSVISIANLDEFLDQGGQKLTISAKLIPESVEIKQGDYVPQTSLNIDDDAMYV